MLEAFKLIVLVNALLAVAFGIFIQGCRLCNTLGISPWWAAGACVYFYAYMLFLRKECRQAKGDL